MESTSKKPAQATGATNDEQTAGAEEDGTKNWLELFRVTGPAESLQIDTGTLIKLGGGSLVIRREGAQTVAFLQAAHHRTTEKNQPGSDK